MDLPFTFKKILELILYPSGIIFLFLLLATLASFSRYRRSQTRFFLVLAFVFFYLSSTPFLCHFLAEPLERDYAVPPVFTGEYAAIVLLPSYIDNRGGLRLYQRFDRETWVRFWAAVELKRRFPQTPLIIVGNGSPAGKGASYLAELARALDLKGVVAIDPPKDTVSSLKALVPLLAGKKFILVTSAYHLPRAMFLARQMSLSPIPYPAFYLSRPGVEISFQTFWPQPHNIFYLNRVVHEYLGLAFYWLVGHIPFL